MKKTKKDRRKIKKNRSGPSERCPKRTLGETTNTTTIIIMTSKTATLAAKASTNFQFLFKFSTSCQTPYLRMPTLSLIRSLLSSNTYHFLGKPARISCLQTKTLEYFILNVESESEKPSKMRAECLQSILANISDIPA
ncbi:unnamed protein product [Hymenolepis diminuta]|uniref:Uncharacterized protein n=1 Tax=Hymenolepis diminuta TaxID=6216 RepID=A0A564XYP7_HYMDI|nr:unnamed protein product [Hymenolepis diminuta]